MFARKTTTFIERASEAARLGLHPFVVIPALNTRHDGAIRSHDGAQLDGVQVLRSTDDSYVERIPEGCQWVGFDEAQFFSPSLGPLVAEIVATGREVVVCGLDLDYRGEPFGAVLALAAKADLVIRLTARCACGARATHSFRRSTVGTTVLVGAEEHYEPRCSPCWTRGNQETGTRT